ncbi:hypothetical protein OVA24_13315 [Luteolibacter sp. SL250]|uniref:hypothetical protein n=1 Tax=Luteolibacter sp. SL250 TaxID=2995170 RepID=UPI00226E1990|nr:hypothetical protein [Luteolibacter sp. SL250]WAC18217.1 hypothetical protein OVA24_13315 [Luteolibacter sp. SL250]
MKNAPVMDFWVTTAIFLSGQTKTPASTHGKMLHEVVTRRDTSIPQEKGYEVRHPALKRSPLFAS